MTSRTLQLTCPEAIGFGSAREFYETWLSQVLVYVLPCFCFFTLFAINPRSFLLLGPTVSALTLLALVFVIALPLHNFRQFQRLSMDAFAPDESDIGASGSSRTFFVGASPWPPKRRAAEPCPPKSPRVAALEESLRRRLGAPSSSETKPRGATEGGGWLDKGRFTPLEWSQLEAAHANLELQFGANLEAVGRAYRRSMYLFHPDRHEADPITRAMAEELSRLFAQAYSMIVRAHQR